MSAGARIKALRLAKKMTQTKLVAAVKKRGGDLSQPQLSAIERGEVDRPGALIEIAEEFAVFPNWLLTGEGVKDRAHPAADFKGPDAVEESLGIVPRARPATTPPAANLAANDTGREPATFPQVEVTGRPDVPVWASAQAGDDGALVLVSDPIDYIQRSERMRGVKNPFAFYVVGTSMSPVIEHGIQVVINPSLPPMSGRDHVFIQDMPDGTMKAMVKRLIRSTERSWRVRQFNEPKDFDLLRAIWTKAYRITEKRED